MDNLKIVQLRNPRTRRQKFASKAISIYKQKFGKDIKC